MTEQSAPTISQDEIRFALKNVTESLEFHRSKRLSAFLNYIVDEHLEGRANQITGTTVAQDVWDKDSSFNSDTDTIVRVMAVKLRKSLAAYYIAAGTLDPVVITLPKGRYAPSFVRRSESSKATPIQRKVSLLSRFKSRKALFGGLLATCMILAVFGSQYSKNVEPTNNTAAPIAAIQKYPTIIVLPFENKTMSPEYDVLEQGLQRQLASDLYQFRVVRVSSGDSTLAEIQSDTSVNTDYVITGLINTVKPNVDISINLIDVPSGTTVLTKRIMRVNESDNYFGTLVAISSELSGDFAGVEGVLVKKQLQDIKSRITNTNNGGRSLGAFDCYAKFGAYFTSNGRDSDLFYRAYNCLTKAVVLYPEDGTLLASLSWLEVVLPLITGEDDDPEATLRKALAMARKAVMIDPRNDVPYGALSAIQYQSGDLPAALISSQQGIALNRGNYVNLGYYATLLAYSGQWDEALSIAEEAIARHPHATGFYYLVPLFRAILDGNGERATFYANFFIEDDSGFKDHFCYFAALASGDDEMVAKLKPSIQAYSDKYNGDPLHGLRRNMGSKEIIDKLESELIKSGISVPEKKL